MAPELIQLLKNRKEKPETNPNIDLYMCDVYSFGILMNEVFSGKKPFEGLNIENCFQRIVTEKEKPTTPIAGASIVNLIKSCWHDDPPSRVSFNYV